MEERKINIEVSKPGVKDKSNFHCYYEALIQHTEWSKPIFLGEKHKCRYCGETDPKQFKRKNAHTFPDSTGNRWLFSDDECKRCNVDFAVFENELMNHGQLMRTLYGITKQGKTSPKYKNPSMSLWRDKVGFKMNALSQNGKELKTEKDGQVQFKDGKWHLSIPEKEYIPLYLFKALCKIAFGIMPIDELQNNRFDYWPWLKHKDISSGDLLNQEYFYIYHNRFDWINREPLLVLFKKHKDYERHPLPTYSFLFSYGNQSFHIFLPYFIGDDWLRNETEVRLLMIPELVVNNDHIDFVWMNGLSTQKTKYKDLNFVVSEKPSLF